MRCRWGEGEGCYAGDADDVPRWQKPSVYRLKLSDLKSSSGLDDMVAINSYNRTKQVCELLHEAVSIGSLDFPTRVDVAACCVRVCLAGVKVGNDRSVTCVGFPLARYLDWLDIWTIRGSNAALFHSTGHAVEGNHDGARQASSKGSIFRSCSRRGYDVRQRRRWGSNLS